MHGMIQRFQPWGAVRYWCTVLAGLLLMQLGACAQVPVTEPANQRPFSFPADVFAFDNQLTWVYSADPQTGRTRHVANNEQADYTLHCFVLVRSVRQFYQFARFDPTRPKATEAVYRERVKTVIGHDPSETGSQQRVVIPGYSDLHAFSADHPALLKELLGSALDSYFQRGNWRMVLPFSSGGQGDTATALAAEVDANRPPVVHLVNFPSLNINHAVLLYGRSDAPQGVRFLAYDPNDSSAPTWIEYDRRAGIFRFPANKYFAGGTVRVYEVYRSFFY